MRKSFEDIAEFVREDHYPDLPEELSHLNYYVEDLGHVIFAIPSGLLEQMDYTKYDLDLFEVALPVKYVLSHDYRFIDDDHIVVKCEYDLKTGPIVDGSWIEM